MLVETTLGGVCRVADRTFEGFFPCVLPLMCHQPTFILEHPPTEAALESRGLVMVLDVGSQSCCIGKPLSAILAVVLLIQAVHQPNVVSQLIVFLEAFFTLLTLELYLLMLFPDVEV